MQMRKLWIIGIFLAMALMLTACGSTQSEELAQTEETAAEESTAGTPAASKGSEDTLIVYFSAANTNDADAVTSATPMTDGESSVGWIADIIAEHTGAEVVKLTPREDYPLEYDAVADQAKQEADSDARPAFAELEVDPAKYKNVFVGYPIWWYQLPMIMDSFFDAYDFSGVNLIPFNTHAGSGDGGTYDEIRELEPDAVVMDGLPVSGDEAGSEENRSEVTEWLQGLGM